MKDCKRFRPEQRLRNQNSFKTLVKKGSFARGRFFYIWVAAKKELAKETGGNRPTLGVVVNKKTQARATGRNILKRRVREIFRKRQEELKTDIAVLIKAKEGNDIPDFQTAEKDILELFKKAGATK